ncbi:MAG TPA: hypothetical protein VMZ29_13190 [Candidatus Bathyarchaeia archaeon]|nr:hypothetical protein [Candidatus Bathyarchaeia archaeon]
MLNEKNDSLPLFIHGFDPFRVWVVKDKIITCGEYWDLNLSRLVAFSFLCDLYRNRKCRNSIPKEFHEILQESINNEYVCTHFPCIMGQFDLEGRTQCLAMKMGIYENDKDIFIKFYDFLVIDCVSCVFSKEFPYLTQEDEIYLSVEEAFFLLANICSSLVNMHLYYTNKRKSFDLEYIQGKLAARYKKNLNRKGNPENGGMYLTDSFTALYCQYLLEQFANKNLSPKTILRLSGAGVLMYLTDSPSVQVFFREIFHELQTNFTNLTRNQKIQFYTLLEISHKWSEHIESEIQSFYEINEHIINSMKQELVTNFPKISDLPHLTIPQKQFHKDYKSGYFTK